MEKLKTNRNPALFIELMMGIHVFSAVVNIITVSRSYSLATALMFGMFNWKDALWLFLYSIEILLSIAVIVYTVVLFWGVCKDINIICKKRNIDSDNLNYIFVRILSGITLGIYYVFWSYRQGKSLEEAAGQYHVKVRGRADIHLILAVSAVVFLWMYAVFSGLVSNGVLSHRFFGIFSVFLNLIYGLLDMANMAYFIQDTDTLSAAYNMQAGDDSVYLERKPSRPGGLVECCEGIYKGAEFAFDKEIVIGRDGAYASIVIDNPKISRKHCVIRYNPQNCGYLVMDTSSNGVFYKSGQALPKNTPIACNAGTILVIGKSGNEFMLK